MAPASGIPVRRAELQFSDAHSEPGAGCAAFGIINGEVIVLTCGQDGRACLRGLPGLEERATLDAGHAHCLAIHPKESLALVCNDSYVKMVKLPDMVQDSAPARASLPIRALAFSPTGDRWVFAGDAANCRVCHTQKGNSLKVLMNDGYVRGLAWDPAGQFVAAAQADGNVFVWDVESGKTLIRTRRTRKLPLLVQSGPVTPIGISWHPDGGALLAVPSEDCDVVLLERLCWDVVGELVGGHTKPVVCATYSPNGLYLASGDEGGDVCVWDMAETRVVATARAAAPHAVFSLTWHPKDNQLVAMNAAGQICLWTGAVPDDLPGPHVSADVLADLQAQEPAALARGGRPDAGDTGGQGGVAAGSEAGDFGAIDDDARSMSDFIVSEGGGGRAALAGLPPRPRYPLPTPRALPSAPPALPPQKPLQPCSTPAASESAPRYLHYTQLGCLTSRPVDDHHVVEVTFHDSQRLLSAGGRAPTIPDYLGCRQGCLGEAGVLLASPPSRDSASMIQYRPFESWAPASEWSAGLPAGEAALCIAAGASFVAAATSRHLLRLFSPAGLQMAIIDLPGQPIALAAQGNQLAVATLAGQPCPVQRKQDLALTVYDVPGSLCLLSAPCPLTPPQRPSAARGADPPPDPPPTSLTWMGFTDAGALAVGDSTGRIHLRSQQWGGCWVPVFDAADHAKAGETYWPVAIQGAELLTIMLPPGTRHPPVSPPPYLTPLPLRQPLLAVDGGSPALESDALMALLMLDAARTRLELSGGGDGAAAAAVGAADIGANRALLKVVNAAIRAGRHARAYDAATQLSLIRSLDGALTLANAGKAPALAERLAELMQQRAEEEEAAGTGGEYGGQVHDHPGCTPIPMRGARPAGMGGSAGAGEDNSGMGHTPGAAKTPLATLAAGGNVRVGDNVAAPPSSGGAGALTALKQAVAVQGPAGQGQDNGAQKRKAGVAPPMNNPFARRPVKQAKG